MVDALKTLFTIVLPLVVCSIAAMRLLGNAANMLECRLRGDYNIEADAAYWGDNHSYVIRQKEALASYNKEQLSLLLIVGVSLSVLLLANKYNNNLWHRNRDGDTNDGDTGVIGTEVLLEEVAPDDDSLDLFVDDSDIVEENSDVVFCDRPD